MLLTKLRSLLITYCLPFLHAAYCSLLTTYHLPCTVCLLRTAYYLQVRLFHTWGEALAAEQPQVAGAPLTLTSVSPTESSIAGGMEMVLGGTGFSTAAVEVDVCGRPCQVVSVSGLELRCTVPSLLVHLSGVQEPT